MHHLFLVLAFLLLSTASLSARVPDWDDTADSGTYTGKDTTINTDRPVTTIRVITEEINTTDGAKLQTQPSGN